VSSDEMLNTLKAALKDNDPRARRAAAEALGKTQGLGVTKALRERTKEQYLSPPARIEKTYT
jgi:HEAT repeat protein